MMFHYMKFFGWQMILTIYIAIYCINLGYFLFFFSFGNIDVVHLLYVTIFFIGPYMHPRTIRGNPEKQGFILPMEFKHHNYEKMQR